MSDKKDKIEVGDTVRIKNETRHGTAVVARVVGTTITLETPLDSFRLWHVESMELVEKKNDTPK